MQNQQQAAKQYLTMATIEEVRTLINQKNYGNALALVKQVINSEDHNNGQTYFLTGEIYQAMGDSETANSYYTICLQFNPHHQRCLLNLGALHYKEQKFDDAAQYFNKCIELNNRDNLLYFYLGRTLQAQNKFIEAQRNYRKCLQLRPGQMKCRNTLAKLQRKMQKTSASKQDDIVELKKKLFLAEKQNQQLKKSFKQAKHLCVVCMQNDSHWINKSCGHCSVCEQCKQLIKNKCPICTKQGQYVKIFFP